jgi:hypothetical protein
VVLGCERGGGIYDLASLLDGGPWGTGCAAGRSPRHAGWSVMGPIISVCPSRRTPAA